MGVASLEDIRARNPIETVIGADIELRPKGRIFKGLCPFHGDHNPSLEVDPREQKFICRACGERGDVFDWVAKRKGVDLAGARRILMGESPTVTKNISAFAPGKTAKQDEPKWWTHGKHEATYIYTDEAGKELFQKRRFRMPDSGKEFPYGRLVNGEFKACSFQSMGVKEVLYRLPAILELQVSYEISDTGTTEIQEWVYLHEGEKAADRWTGAGYVSTCTRLGASQLTGDLRWHRDYTEQLRGRRVCIVSDNDEQGLRHAQLVARELVVSATEVRITRSKTTGAKDDGYDHLEAGFTPDDLIPVPVDPSVAAPPRKPTQTDPKALAKAADPKAFPWTDLGNAERLILAYGDEIRYCHAWKRFLTWDGSRFLTDEKGEAPVMGRVKAIVRATAARAAEIENEDDLEKFQKFIAGCENRPKLENIIGLAKKDEMVAVAPDDLDQDAWLLNLLNGTVDLRTGKVTDHSRGDLITKCVPVVFDPSATCPNWLRFLSEIMDGDGELVAFLHRATGYSLTGDVREHVLFFLHGVGSNGKGTLMDILLTLVGDYGKSLNSEALMLSKFVSNNGPTPEIAKLKGARLVAAPETGEGKRIDEAKVKELTGGDRITACMKYGDPFEFNPSHKFWISGNHKPEIRGTDNGIWRRICLIPFNVTFGEPGSGASKIKDATLGIRLRAELPGILNWAIRGCMDWQQRSLDPPEAVRVAVSEYRASMDILGEFLDVAIERLGGASIRPSELYSAYQKWCAETGTKPLSATRLGRDMADRGEHSTLTHGQKLYRDMRLKEGYAPSYENVYRGGD